MRFCHSLYYLDALVWALDFACSTSQAVIDIDGVRFTIIYFINGNWASIFAGSTAVTLACIYFDLNHFAHLLLEESYQDKYRRIKAFTHDFHSIRQCSVVSALSDFLSEPQQDSVDCCLSSISSSVAGFENVVVCLG